MTCIVAENDAKRERYVFKTVENLRKLERSHRLTTDDGGNCILSTPFFSVFGRKLPTKPSTTENEFFNTVKIKSLKEHDVFQGRRGTYVVLHRWGRWTCCIENRSTREQYCLRMEPLTLSNRMPKLYRQIVVHMMSDRIKNRERHFLDMVEYGTTNKFNYVITEVANISLWDFRAQVLSGKDFSRSTAAQASLQILQAINDAICYCHVVSRFVHPRNFLIGCKSNIHVVYMIDFSMGYIYYPEPKKSSTRESPSPTASVTPTNTVSPSNNDRKKSKAAATKTWSPSNNDRNQSKGCQTPTTLHRFSFLDHRFMPKSFHRNEEYSVFDEMESFIYVVYDLWTQFNPMSMARNERDALVAKEALLSGRLPLEYGVITSMLCAMARFNADERRTANVLLPDFAQYGQMLIWFFDEMDTDMWAPLDWVNTEITGAYRKRRQAEKQDPTIAQKKVEFDPRVEADRIGTLCKNGIVRGSTRIKRVRRDSASMKRVIDESCKKSGSKMNRIENGLKKPTSKMGRPRDEWKRLKNEIESPAHLPADAKKSQMRDETDDNAKKRSSKMSRVREEGDKSTPSLMKRSDAADLSVNKPASKNNSIMSVKKSTEAVKKP